jgi:hypothetical protein
MNQMQFFFEYFKLQLLRNFAELFGTDRFAIHEEMQLLRRYNNRQIMSEYSEKTKVSMPMAREGYTVFVKGGQRKYYPPMEA